MSKAKFRLEREGFVENVVLENKSTDYFKGVWKARKGNLSNHTFTEKYNEEIGKQISLIQKDGDINKLNYFILEAGKKAACLKDRIVLLLITMDTLPVNDQEGTFFKTRFEEITKEVDEFINDYLLNTDLQKIVGELETKSSISETIKSVDRLKSIGEFLDKRAQLHEKTLQSLFSQFDTKKGLKEEEKKELTKLSQQEVSEDYFNLRDYDIAVITTTNFKHQLLRNSLELLINRLKGYETMIPLLSTYELPQLYQQLKNKIELKKEWKIEEYGTSNLDLTTFRIIKEGNEKKSELIEKAHFLLNQIDSNKELIAITNKILTGIVSPKQSDSLEEHQRSLDELARIKFKNHSGIFNENIEKADNLFIQIKECITSLNQALESLKEETPNEEILKKAESYSCTKINFEKIKDQKNCYEKHAQLCKSEIAYLNRLVEMIEYRLEGLKVPLKFTSYVSAWTSRGSLKGQVQELGNRIYLLGDEKGKTIVGDFKFFSLKTETNSKKNLNEEQVEPTIEIRQEEISKKEEIPINKEKIDQKEEANKKESEISINKTEENIEQNKMENPQVLTQEDSPFNPRINLNIQEKIESKNDFTRIQNKIFPTTEKKN